MRATKTAVAESVITALVATAQNTELLPTSTDVIITSAQPAAPKKQPLSNAARKVQERDAKCATIGDHIAAVGDAIGAYTADHELMQGELRVLVETHLRAAMDVGLTVEMLKAPTKDNPSECYTLLLEGMNAPRLAADLPELKEATRNNYFSRIRAYVRDRGANPLDLFGNFAVAKAKAGKGKKEPANDDGKEARETEHASGTGSNVARGTDESLIGLPALDAYLVAWLAANQGKVIAKYTDLVSDLHKSLASVIDAAKKAG